MLDPLHVLVLLLIFFIIVQFDRFLIDTLFTHYKYTNTHEYGCPRDSIFEEIIFLATFSSLAPVSIGDFLLRKTQGEIKSQERINAHINKGTKKGKKKYLRQTEVTGNQF